MAKKRIKVGVTQRQGPPPGYQWNAWILDIAFNEAMGFLKTEQYGHLRMQVQDLASEDSPSQSPTLSVEKMSGEQFYELRDKGGVLKNLNVRVFFGIDHDRRSIVILGTIHKKNDGPTPRGTIITMRRRWRKYRNGDYGYPRDG